MNEKKAAQRTLVFRLSSLGDLILSLEALKGFETSTEKVDFVVAREFAHVLKGHPSIGEVIAFDRKSGLRGWWRTCRELRLRPYAEVWDLHRSLRTAIARIAFFSFGGPRWRMVSKERWRFWGYCLFKSLWPKKFRPRAWAQRFAEFSCTSSNASSSVGSRIGPARLDYLLSEARQSPEFSIFWEQFVGREYHCVMPASSWRTKEWPVDKFVELIARMGGTWIVMGTDRDRASFELFQKLSSLKNIKVYSGINRWNFAETSGVIAGAKSFLSNDTGLYHLSVALGVPALAIHGPTTADAGFSAAASWGHSVGADLWCRPCGKDGRSCHRIRNRHICLKSLEVEKVFEAYQRLATSARVPKSQALTERL